MNSNDIKNELRAQLDKVGTRLLECPWENKDFYSLWLAQTTYFVRHSSRLLTMVAAYCPQHYQKFHTKFISHAAEEKGHENLSAMDLKTLGHKVEDFPELPSTQSFYQPQYYWIQFKNPLAFLGYALTLECLAMERGGVLTQRAEKHYGPKAAHFLRVHAADDVDHVKEAMELLDAVPSEALEPIYLNLRQAFINYESILEECCEHIAKQSYKSAS